MAACSLKTNQCKLYSYACCPKTYKVLITARYAGIQLEQDPSFIFGETNKSECFLKKFPFGKVPAMVTPDGPIYESTAICTYLAESNPQARDRLLGSTPYERALVSQFVAMTDNELMAPLSAWTYPLFGIMPFNAELNAKARSDTFAVLEKLDQILLSRTFLVGEQPTLADISLACALYMAFKVGLGPESRKKFQNLTRWYLTCFAQPKFACHGTQCTEAELFCEKELTEPMKKPCGGSQSCKATTAEAAEPSKPTPSKVDVDSLPPSTFILDDWKRFYSNNSVDASEAYFYKNWDPSGFSLYRFTYLYPEELTKVFMASNLVGGVFQRMDPFRKHLFGTMCVFGQENDLEISGMFIIRGTELPQFMYELPDYESFKIEKVDPNDPSIRTEWRGYLSWEGEFKKPFADGKVFK